MIASNESYDSLRLRASKSKAHRAKRKQFFITKFYVVAPLVDDLQYFNEFVLEVMNLVGEIKCLVLKFSNGMRIDSEKL